MWSISLHRPFGSLSARRTTLFVSAIILALFASLMGQYTVSAQIANPSSDVMATWEGEGLQYGPTSFTRSESPESDENVPGLIDTPCEDNQNVFYSPQGTRDDDDEHYWMYVICLTADYDGDKSEAIPARLLEYRVPRDDHELNIDNARNFNEHGELREIAIRIAPLGTDSLGRTGGETATNCSSEFTHGLGWIICPVTNWLAAGMDALFTILSSFLTVSPLSTDRSGALYYIWDLMRNFANLLFIVGFLIIIYSQITSVGVSNYGIKRILPRLIIAAVLVNVSYWIAAIAVDLSNILGVSLQNLFVEIREGIPAGEGPNPEDLSWRAIAGVVLSGGAAALSLGGLAAGVLASAGGSLWFLLVGLMGIMVSMLVAILVLAARQALITILIIISPLAFVAFLLPSTEKYFDRWRSIFMTMLLVFPMFSIVFGGAQLAGLAIIMNASPDSPNYFNVIILGMVVQVAPVVITPLLVKLSGSLLGRIAGIVNDPNKGLIDRTRKYAQTRHDMTKNRQLYERDKDGNFKHTNPLAWSGRRLALKEMNRANKVKAWESGAEALWEQDHRAHETHRQSTINEMYKSEGADRSKAEVAREVNTRESLQRLYAQQHISKGEAEAAESRNKTMLDEMKAKPGVTNAAIRDLAYRMHDVSVETQDESQRQSSLTQEYDSQYWRGLASDTARQAHAGAAGIAEQGEARIANIARQKQNEEREKLVNAGLATINQLELTNDDRMNIIFGNKPTSPRAADLRSDFHLDLENQSASIRSAFENMPQFMKHELIENLEITMDANGDRAAETKRSELVGQLKKNKPIWISSTILNKMEEGALETKYKGRAGTELMIKEEVIDKRGSSAKTLATADRDDLKRVSEWIKRNKTYFNSNTVAKEHLQKELIKVYNLDEFAGALEKRVNELDDMWLAAGLDADKDKYSVRDGKVIGL